MVQLLDPKHPFFAPRGRRIAIVAVCAGWGGYELFLGNGLWGALFLLIALYLVWQLFISFDAATKDDEND